MLFSVTNFISLINRVLHKTNHFEYNKSIIFELKFIFVSWEDVIGKSWLPFTLDWTVVSQEESWISHFSFSECFPHSHGGDLCNGRVSLIFLLLHFQIAAWIILSDLDWWFMKAVLSFLFQENLSLKCLAFQTNLCTTSHFQLVVVPVYIWRERGLGEKRDR